MVFLATAKRGVGQGQVFLYRKMVRETLILHTGFHVSSKTRPCRKSDNYSDGSSVC